MTTSPIRQRVVGVFPDKKPLGGSVGAGLVVALCCGGLPLFASIGLGTFFAGLGLARHVSQLVVGGALVIVALNWLYYRRRAQRSGGAGSLRPAMLVSAGIGLAALVAVFFFLDWLEHVINVERFLNAASESPALKSRSQAYALAVPPAAMAVLLLLPFPGPGARRRGPAGAEWKGRSQPMSTADIPQIVRSRYGAFAKTGGQQESCCATAEASPSFAVDHGLYSEAELARVPDLSRDLSRGCGNPTGFANLQAGEVVVDFGSGGGIDVILAAQQVGPQGKVVGIDMTPEMVERAREAVGKAGLEDRDVKVRVEDITSTQLPDASADVVISNCVINLAPDKDAVYREARRILRPGGRLAISDMVLSEPIADDVQERFRSSWAGCLGGMVPEGDYLDLVRRAGFSDIQVVARHPLGPDELEAMSRCPGPEFSPATPPDDLAMVQGKAESIKFTARA
jgi:SAM-dependent methyltransferase